MGFQVSVNIENAFGIQGSIYDDGPVRSAPYTLNSASAAYNVIGATAYTLVSADPGDNSASAVAAAGNNGGAFVGILMNTKVYGTSGGTNSLSPTLTLPNQILAELLTMGDIVVALPGPANVGDYVAYDNTTGALSTYPQLAKFTASIAITTGILTVTAVAAGQLQVGQLISGTDVPPGTYIVSFDTGTGNTGTYNTNITPAGAIASTAMTAPSLPPSAASFTASFDGAGNMVVTAVGSGEIAVGQVLSGTHVPAGTVVTGMNGNTGGTGTYLVNTLVVGASGTVTSDATTKVPSAEVYQFQPTGAVGGVGVIKITA